MCPYDGFATASATFGSQNLGAGNLKRIREGLKSGIIISVIYSIAIGIVLIFAGSKIALIFVSGSETEVLGYAQQLLTCAGFFLFLSGIPELHTTDHSGARLQCHCHVCRIK